MNAIPNEQEQQESEHELLGFFVDLINAGDLVAVLRLDGQLGWMAVLRLDGQLGWMPAPANDVADVRICQICGGSGFLSPAIASIVTPDFRLANMCPDCHGTGINEAVNEVTPTEPLPSDGDWMPF